MKEPLSGGKNVLQILMKFPIIVGVDRNLHFHQINSNTSTNGNLNHIILPWNIKKLPKVKSIFLFIG